MTIELERLQDLSIYYWLTDLLASVSVSVFDGYQDQELVIPSVSVVNEDIVLIPHELGTSTNLRSRIFDLDVIGNTKTQRDALASMIIVGLEGGIPVYDYNEGFPPSVSPTQISTLSPLRIQARMIRIFPELVEKLYWRSSIRFIVEYIP